MNRTDMKSDNEYSLNQRKKGNVIVKTITAILIIIIVIYVVPALFFLYIFGESDMKLNQEKENVGKQAEQIVTERLKEKYPEKNFEITDIGVGAYGNFSKSVDTSNVKVHVKENNEEYSVVVNTRERTIVDNVQQKEIVAAIHEKINEIVKINSNDKEYEYNSPMADYYRNIKINSNEEKMKESNKCIHSATKFNGDIIDFLGKERLCNKSSLRDNWGELEIFIFCVDGEEEFDINKRNNEFLQSFEKIFVINYKNNIKTHGDISYVSKEYFLKDKDLLNSFYVYDKDIQNFKNILQ